MARCRTCGLHLRWCVCVSLPAIRLPFDVWLIQHAAEQDRPTNSGRVLLGMLPESRLFPVGVRGVLFDPRPLEEAGSNAVLLFPAPDAPVLHAHDLSPRGGHRATLILLDATWAQASRLRQRIPILRGLPCRRLPPGSPGRWRIRCASTDGRLCTLEAGIRAIREAGYPGEADRMDLAQDLVMQRMLYMKGRTATLAPVPTGLMPAAETKRDTPPSMLSDELPTLETAP